MLEDTMEFIPDDVIVTDVLVLGGGGAGVIAALKSSENSDEVVLVTKDSGCTPDLTGFNVALGFGDSLDNPDTHFKDTVEGGALLNDQKLVRILVNEAVDIFAELRGIGVKFRRENDRFAQHLVSGCTFPRTTHHQDPGTTLGTEILKHLFREIRHRGVEVVYHL